uniref:Neuroglian n=1 Tax=Panagrellus redivivus TaxID=6233 RepID=A0A7E4V282_PANRE
MFTLLRVLFTATAIGQLSFALGPPKLTGEPPDEVWFEPTTPLDDFDETKLTLRCEAEGNPENFEWRKNNEKLNVDGKEIIWQDFPESGTIFFTNPTATDAGYYQCFASNIFGTAVSNRVHVQLGVLGHFPARPLRTIKVDEGDSLSIDCKPPYGIPKATIFWLYRDTNQTSVIETIRRPHVTVDPEGKLHFSAVSAHDGRPNLIYECAATSPVMRGEYRAGDRVQLVVREKTRIICIGAHKLYTSPENVNVRAGKRLKLMCIFGGRPVPVIEWSKLDDSLPFNRMKDLSSVESDYGRALIIDNAHPEDAGTYECRAGDLYHHMTVSVTASPFWVFEPPKDVNHAEESTAELQCLASGSPIPLIQWYINGKPLYELPDNDRRIILDAGRVLRIDNLDHDVDTGVYQCNASNALGYVFANAFVNVRAYAPRFKMPDKRVWKVVRKSTVDLSCDVDAAPDPIIRWVDANDQAIHVVPTKLNILSNHTLRIFDVNTADEGFYYCNVSNKYGLNRAYNKLEVYNPTYFVQVPSPKRIVVEANQSVELHCEATADNRLTIDYIWQLNHKLINKTESITVNNGVSTLRLENLRGNNSGLIDCSAVTDVDVKISGIKLIVRDTPDPPDVVSIECSSRRAIIQWRKPDDHGSEITRFTVEMMTGFKPDEWQVVVEELEVTPDVFQAIITLSPWVNYTFKVVAYNSYGASEPGFPKNVLPGYPHCTTPKSIPYSNPIKVSASGTEPNNLVVRWAPMDKYDWNAPELRYLVRYKLNAPDEEWKEFLVEDPVASQTIIREQPTYQEYLIQVIAVNSEGKSAIKPETIIGFSGEDVPTEAPKNFKLKQFHNFSTVEFTWDPVDPRTVRGAFKQYKLVYWVTEKPHFVDYVEILPEFTTAIIRGLEAMKNYSVQVYVANNGYTSEPSESISFSTPEGAPSKVHNLQVHAVGANSAVAVWEPPKHPNGHIRGYFITFENSTSGEIEETYVLYRQRHYLHEGLTPDSSYRVAVWAETNGGEGPKVTRLIQTFSVKEPDSPRFEAKTSPNSINIDWLPSNGSIWKMPGASFYVNYSKENSNDWIQTPDIDLPNTNIVLDDLEENTNYVIVAVAKEGNRISEALPITLFTEGQGGVSHINHENLQNAVWFIAVLCALAVALLLICCMCICARRRSGKYAVKKKEIEHGLNSAHKKMRIKKTTPSVFFLLRKA